MEFKKIKLIQTSTVKVVSEKFEGSGVLIDKKGRVATCDHVVGNKRRGRVRLFGDEELEADYSVSVRDKDWDIAILQSRPNLFSVIRESMPKFELPDFITKRKDIKAGMVVGICGYPWLTETPGSALSHPPTVTMGVISYLRPKGKPIALSAPLHHGNSGGPVFTEFGYVLGLASQSSMYQEEEIGNPLSMGVPLGYGEMIPFSMVRIVAART